MATNARAAGVILIGGDQSEINSAVSDRGVKSAITRAARHSAVVLTDGAMTAVMGKRYATDAGSDDDNYEDEAILDFRAGNAKLQPGFNVVRGVTLEPRLTRDYRWGRLFDAARPHPSTLSVGVSELTALEVRSGGAAREDQGGKALRVVGERSVTTLDARYARFIGASNGTFGPGQRL